MHRRPAAPARSPSGAGSVTALATLREAANTMGDTYSEADIAEAAGALESRGIKWAWQMCQMDKDDWKELGISGLKAAKIISLLKKLV